MRTIQPSFGGGEVSPAMYGRVDLAKYQTAAKQVLNFVVHAHGGISNRPGTAFIAEALGADSRFIKFQFNTEQGYVLEFGDHLMRVIKDGGLVLSGESVYQVATPYAAEDLPLLKFVQSADTMYLCHPDYPAYTLTRTGHAAWSFTAVSFAPTVSAPSGLSATASDTTLSDDPSATAWAYAYKVSATSTDGEESLPCSAVSVNADPPNNWNADGKISLSWSAVSSAKQYNVYKNTNGYYGFIGLSESTSFTDDNIEPDVSDGPQGEFDGLQAADDYPSVPTFFEQRLILAGTNDQPQTVWASQTGIFNNFATANPLKDSDGIEATIVSRQVNEIRHFVPLQDLVIFTAGAEWKMAHGSNSDGLTPTSIQFKVQGYRGSSHVPPLVVGDTVLHLQRGSRTVRDLAYTLVDDAYKGSNLSVLADHLTRNNKIVSWDYQQTPYSMVWCVRDDGLLLGLTYMREHEVWAWSRHVTDGRFLDVCVLDGDDADECYFLVKREIGGTAKYFIEKMAERMENDELERAWIVDSGLRYEGAAATAMSGLDHLEGETVVGLADGSPLPPLTVENGAVTLPRAASVVTLGLPYASDLETLNIDVNASETLQGRKKNVTAVTMRFENSLGGFAGPDEDHLVEIKPPLQASWGQPADMRTDDYRISLTPAWNTNGRIFFRQAQPLPVTILAVIPEVKVGG